MAPPPHLVPDQMDSLFRWMREASATVHPLILSSVFHYEFVFIHPFSDGNGRIARLWQTALLSTWNPVFQYLPLESRIHEFQDDYYEAIAACHSAGPVRYLCGVHAGQDQSHAGLGVGAGFWRRCLPARTCAPSAGP